MTLSEKILETVLKGYDIKYEFYNDIFSFELYNVNTCSTSIRRIPNKDINDESLIKLIDETIINNSK